MYMYAYVTQAFDYSINLIAGPNQLSYWAGLFKGWTTLSSG